MWRSARLIDSTDEKVWTDKREFRTSGMKMPRLQESVSRANVVAHGPWCYHILDTASVFVGFACWLRFNALFTPSTYRDETKCPDIYLNENVLCRCIYHKRNPAEIIS